MARLGVFFSFVAESVRIGLLCLWLLSVLLFRLLFTTTLIYGQVLRAWTVQAEFVGCDAVVRTGVEMAQTLPPHKATVR